MPPPTRLYPQFEGLRTPLLALGLVLVGLGTILLIYIALMAIKVINHPQEVPVVQFALETIAVGERALSGRIGEQDIEINLSDPVRSALYIFMGIALFGVIAGILKVVISSGISLIRLASSAPEPRAEANKPGQHPYNEAP